MIEFIVKSFFVSFVQILVKETQLDIEVINHKFSANILVKVIILC